ncbi:MAG: SDR family oxidoreductase [Planctomycetales bacterium]|nr:SDR family oxidoreductase [Planctomycetales bacterium]NIN76676.1 SDR family oxidoreductase [Planctomycetales bacterium]NIO33864.1 SDR family oxidoreductase [Planctomycetales bacterium]NIO45671.1 SDR family oxidoreductase [Planctomycetales bacterium]NIP68295.1 SDR family oxidoreductase [Planctomycetales bacterium]
MSAAYLQQLFAMDGQVAVVIGGTGVLGGALAEGIAQAGATVVVAGRSAPRGDQRVKAIEALGGRAEFAQVDACDKGSVESLLATTLKQCGRCDMLVNCAGVNAADPYFDIREEDFDRVLATNLKATHFGCQVFGQHMSQAPDGGAILNIGSVSAHLPLSRVYAYSAAKAAVLNLTKNVARELAPHGVRVNSLCPGFFPAEQNRKILTAERVESILRKTPMGRFGEPAELIGASLLLLSRTAGRFITGTEIYVDGGFTGMSI